MKKEHHQMFLLAIPPPPPTQLQGSPVNSTGPSVGPGIDSRVGYASRRAAAPVPQGHPFWGNRPIG